MNYQYNPYFSTQTDVVYEMINVIRLHSNGRISNDELEDILLSYIKGYHDFIFDVVDDKLTLKGFPKQKFGKKRIRIIGACLVKHQLIKSFDVDKGEFIAPQLSSKIA